MILIKHFAISGCPFRTGNTLNAFIQMRSIWSVSLIFANICSKICPTSHKLQLPISWPPCSTTIQTWMLACFQRHVVAEVQHSMHPRNTDCLVHAESSLNGVWHRQGRIHLLSPRIVPGLGPWIRSCNFLKASRNHEFKVDDVWEALKSTLTVVIWWTECVLLHWPSRWKYDEVCDCSAGSMAGTCQNGKNTRILNVDRRNVFKASRF